MIWQQVVRFRVRLVRLWLDLTIFKVFSNLSNSMTLWSLSKLTFCSFYNHSALCKMLLSASFCLPRLSTEAYLPTSSLCWAGCWNYPPTMKSQKYKEKYISWISHTLDYQMLLRSKLPEPPREHFFKLHYHLLQLGIMLCVPKPISSADWKECFNHQHNIKSLVFQLRVVKLALNRDILNYSGSHPLVPVVRKDQMKSNKPALSACAFKSHDRIH